jgi:hypothetical protein
MNFRMSSQQIAAGWTGAPEVKVFNTDGQLTHIVRWQQGVEFFPPGELEAFISEFPEDRREEVRGLVDSTPGGIPRPFFTGIYIDEQGNLWVRTERSSRTSVHRYLKFALDGSESGYVDLPGNPRISVISDREVLGLWWEAGASVLRDYHIGSASPP